MANEKLRTNLGVYMYECPDVSALGRAYKQWVNDQPITECTRIGWRNGVNPWTFSSSSSTIKK